MTATTRARAVAGRPSDRSVLLERCGDCLLTWTAAELLASVVDGFARRRGDDGTWHAERCSRCHRFTAVVDHLDGSVFGEASRPRPMPVELVPPPAALGARPRRHRRHRIGRWIAIPVAGIMTAAVAAGAFAMVYGASRSPAVREVVIDATRAATPVATPPAQDAAPSPAGVTGFTPTGIEVRKVETIIDDDRVSVVARIWNGRAEPATAMEVSFVAVGTDGGAVAEDTRVVDLAAKRGATIATDDLPIGSTEDVASVRISIHATGRSSDAIPELLVSDVRTDEVGSAVTGVLANEGDLSANATISCVVRDGSGVLVTAASDDVSVAGVASRSFRLPLTPAPPTGSSVACDAVPGAPF